MPPTINFLPEQFSKTFLEVYLYAAWVGNLITRNVALLTLALEVSRSARWQNTHSTFR
jgi:hypothetical protein